LSIYHWFEYIPQELLDKFSKEHDIEVTMDTFESNEGMLASLKAGKLGSYDVSVPGDYMVKIMANEGILDTFERSELSNFDNIEEQWVDVPFDEGRKSSIPYQFGTTGFMVNREAFAGDINSLGVIFDPPAELQGSINSLDSQGEVIALASMYLGIPQCTSDREQLKKLNDALLSAKEHLKFMNFLLEPENAAAVTNFAQYISPVKGAMDLASEDVKSAPELNPPADQPGQFVATCEQAVQENYDRIWTNLKK